MMEFASNLLYLTEQTENILDKYPQYWSNISYSTGKFNSFQNHVLSIHSALFYASSK